MTFLSVAFLVSSVAEGNMEFNRRIHSRARPAAKLCCLLAPDHSTTCSGAERPC
jgi:hypothetical protein